MNFTNFFSSTNLFFFQMFWHLLSLFKFSSPREHAISLLKIFLAMVFNGIKHFNILYQFFDKVAFLKFLKFLFSGQGTSYRVC